MSARQHLTLLAQGIGAWVVFWLMGWPDYFQQYSPAVMGSASVLLQVLISLWALQMLLRTSAPKRMSHAVWLAVYFSVPLALLDVIYCGLVRGHGFEYLVRYWYLTVFYFSVWLTMVPTAMLLKVEAQRPG